jgi:opacity protein-like surface antigen
MRKSTLFVTLVIVLSNISCAGGNITPIEPIEESPQTVENASVFKSVFYMGAGYSYLQSNRYATLHKPGEADDGKTVKNTDSAANNLMLMAGYQYNPYLAIEGRYTVSIGDHTLTDNLNNGYKEDVDIDISNIALYLKPMYLVGNVSFYGLLGYGKTQRKHNVRGSSWDGSGFQWGGGVQYMVGGNLSIFADYTQWYDEEDELHPTAPRLLDTDFSTVSTGITYKF